jgi:hypothetical protein
MQNKEEDNVKNENCSTMTEEKESNYENGRQNNNSESNNEILQKSENYEEKNGETEVNENDIYPRKQNKNTNPALENNTNHDGSSSEQQEEQQEEQREEQQEEPREEQQEEPRQQPRKDPLVPTMTPTTILRQKESGVEIPTVPIPTNSDDMTATMIHDGHKEPVNIEDDNDEIKRIPTIAKPAETQTPDDEEDDENEDTFLLSPTEMAPTPTMVTTTPSATD